jgi:hypothetical protein
MLSSRILKEMIINHRTYTSNRISSVKSTYRELFDQFFILVSTWVCYGERSIFEKRR